MRYLVSFLIEFIYRKIIKPKMTPRYCLFKISCSEYVLRAAKNEGLIAAIRALHKRYCLCGGNLETFCQNGQLIVRGKHEILANLSEFKDEVCHEIEIYTKTMPTKLKI